MAETPFSPASPEDPSTTPAGAPEPPPAVDEEPAVEGWSGTPTTASSEEATARPEPAAPPPAPEPEPTPAPAPAATPIEPASVFPAPVPAPSRAAEPSEIPADPTPSEAQPEAPTIAATLEVPPLPGADTEEGGEFDLLVSKLRTWLNEADLAGRWQQLRGPLKGVALLLALILGLRLYARVVGTIDGIPLVSGLLELTGLIYLLWFTTTRLLRTSERQRVLSEWNRRWQDFSGRN
jgi:hypothetical protein